MDEYQYTDSRPALDAAVGLVRNTVALAVDNDPQRTTALASLGAALSPRAPGRPRGPTSPRAVARRADAEPSPQQ